MNRAIAMGFVLWLVAVFSTAMAQPVPIPTLFSTGVSDLGLALPDFGADPHYTLSSSPLGFYPVGPAITVAAAAFTPAWVPNTATSQWVNPNGLGGSMVDWHVGGIYVYTTIFDLTGFIPTTTTIDLVWAADDNDTGLPFGPYDFIAVNGFPVAATGTGPAVGSYTGFHPEILGPTLPWLPGINTLDFVIANTDSDPGPGLTGPTGLHVKILSAEAVPIPEPSSLLLFTLGLAGTMVLVRRWSRGRLAVA